MDDSADCSMEDSIDDAMYVVLHTAYHDRRKKSRRVL